MRRLYLALCTFLILASGIGITALVTRTIAPPPAPTVAPPPVRPILGGFPVGSSWTVDVTPGESMVAQLTQYDSRNKRPVVDQYLDWLMLGVLNAATDSAADLAKTTFDLPSSRLGYLKQAGNPEYGPTRSRDIGNGVVIALVPADRTDVQRRDDLAHVADDQSKNIGRRIERIIVVEVALDTELGTATLTRRPDVPAAELFSAAYGYKEATVGSSEELASFLADVQDITHVRREDSNRLVLGGRKLLGRDYRGIGMEPLAALWQAQRKLRTAEDRVQSTLDVYKYDLESQMRYGGITVSEAQRKFDEYARTAWRTAKIGGTGFSLDPSYRFKEMAAALRRVSPLLVAVTSKDPLPVTAEAAGQAASAAEAGNVVPLLQLKEVAVGDAKMLLGLLEQDFRFQAARYDGDLQGTEAGMILFYTDLIAKIWVINFEDTTPFDLVKDFVNLTSLKTAPIYDDENRKLPSARLWFGPSDLGFSLDNSRDALFFSRIATRIYSAGSNPLRPGEEVQTSAFLGAPIDWWNDHYEEVASKEPEYERLNELMKWSIILGWLNDRNSLDQLNYLAEVPVDRSHRLPEWAARHPELRFRQWDKVNFYEPGFAGTTTEAMAILFSPSKYFQGASGGVSLANRDVVRMRRGFRTSDDLLARSNIDYAASGSGRLVTFEKTTFSVAQGDARIATNTITLKPDAKLRGPVSQVGNGPIEQSVLRSPEAVVVESRLGEAPIGRVAVEATPNGFSVSWRARALDTANVIAAEASRTGNIAATVAGHPKVKLAIELPDGGGVAVKMRGGDEWILLKSEAAPPADFPAGWQSRSAYPDAKIGVNAKMLDTASLLALIGDGNHLVLDATGRPLLHVAKGARSGASGSASAELGGRTVSGWKEAGSEVVHVDAQTLVGASGDGAAISAAAPGSAAKAAARPAEFVRQFDQELAADLKAADRLRSSGFANDSQNLLRDLADRYGPQPDLLIRRAIGRIEGKLARLAAGEVKGPPRALRDRSSFFEEVNARLKGATEEAGRQIEDLARFADWSDRAARDLGRIGHPTLLPGENVQLGFKLDKAPEALGKSTRVTEPGRVYVADDAGLANLDWSGQGTQSLNQVLVRDLGQVVRLPDTDLARFRPTTIVLPDGRVAKLKSHPLHSASGHYTPAQESGSCPDGGNPQCATTEPVYIVLPKAA